MIIKGIGITILLISILIFIGIIIYGAFQIHWITGIASIAITLMLIGMALIGDNYD